MTQFEQRLGNHLIKCAFNSRMDVERAKEVSRDIGTGAVGVAGPIAGVAAANALRKKFVARGDQAILRSYLDKAVHQRRLSSTARANVIKQVITHPGEYVSATTNSAQMDRLAGKIYLSMKNKGWKMSAAGILAGGIGLPLAFRHLTSKKEGDNMYKTAGDFEDVLLASLGAPVGMIAGGDIGARVAGNIETLTRNKAMSQSAAGMARGKSVARALQNRFYNARAYGGLAGAAAGGIAIPMIIHNAIRKRQKELEKKSSIGVGVSILGGFGGSAAGGAIGRKLGGGKEIKKLIETMAKSKISANKQADILEKLRSAKADEKILPFFRSLFSQGTNVHNVSRQAANFGHYAKVPKRVALKYIAARTARNEAAQKGRAIGGLVGGVGIPAGLATYVALKKNNLEKNK